MKHFGGTEASSILSTQPCQPSASQLHRAARRRQVGVANPGDLHRRTEIPEPAPIGHFIRFSRRAEKMNSRAAVCLWAAYVAHVTAGELDRPAVRDLAAMAANYYEAGARLHAAGNYRDAETQYARSIKTWETAYGTEHPGLVRLLNRFTALCLDSLQFARAETVTRRALDIERAAPGVMPATDEATTFIHLGSIHRALRRLEESESAFLQGRGDPQDRSLAEQAAHCECLEQSRRVRSAPSMSWKQFCPGSVPQRALGEFRPETQFPLRR
jgi:hypothetical protein